MLTSCPFVEKFSLEIETYYTPDGGEQENVFNLKVFRALSSEDIFARRIIGRDQTWAEGWPTWLTWWRTNNKIMYLRFLPSSPSSPLSPSPPWWSLCPPHRRIQQCLWARKQLVDRSTRTGWRNTAPPVWSVGHHRDHLYIMRMYVTKNEHFLRMSHEKWALFMVPGLFLQQFIKGDIENTPKWIRLNCILAPWSHPRPCNDDDDVRCFVVYLPGC